MKVRSSTDIANLRLSLVTLDERCLEKSWKWLNDPEVRELTMTPPFTREDQRRFFEQLPSRTDYRIWGVALGGVELIGAAGIKDHRESIAQYWGYIGEKKYWGRGLGRSLVAKVESEARELGFNDLDLIVSAKNTRAITLYESVGFVRDPQATTGCRIRMVKRGI